MSLLSHNELLEIVLDGVISAETSQVNAASIDVRLGSTVMVEVDTRNRPFVRLADKADGVAWERREIPVEGYYLKPGEIILAETLEVFHLPDNLSAEFKLKSSLARSCLDHALAGWCDAGWNGSVLTLELKNNSRYHTLILDKGMKIGQMIFYRHAPVPPHASYAATGRYNHDLSVNASKGLV